MGIGVSFKPVAAEGFVVAVLLYEEGAFGIVSVNLVIFTELMDIELADLGIDY